MFNAFVLEHIYLKYAPQKRTTQIMRMKQLIETIIIGRITLKSLSSIVFIEKEYLKRYYNISGSRIFLLDDIKEGNYCREYIPIFRKKGVNKLMQHSSIITHSNTNSKEDNAFLTSSVLKSIYDDNKKEESKDIFGMNNTKDSYIGINQIIETIKKCTKSKEDKKGPKVYLKIPSIEKKEVNANPIDFETIITSKPSRNINISKELSIKENISKSKFKNIDDFIKEETNKIKEAHNKVQIIKEMMKAVLSLNESPMTSNRLITDTSNHFKGKSMYIRHINTNNGPYTQQNTIISKIAEKCSSDIQFPLVKRKLTTKKAIKASSKNVKFRVVSNEKKKILNPQRRKTTNNTTYHLKGKSFDKKLIIIPKQKYSEKQSPLFKLNIIKDFPFSTIETE